MARKRKRPAKRGKRRSGRGPEAGILFLARRGVPDAQFQLGEMYWIGEGGLKSDAAKAARWFRAAAEQGHTDAQMLLAELCHEGDGVEQDFEEAAKWLRAAAEAGDADALVLLGMMYADFEADMDEDPEGESRLEVAAAAGHKPARYLLIALRGEDEFAEPDPEEFREIAEVTLREAWRGDPDAQFFAAFAYHKGLGVPKDDVEAMRWLRAAARQGDAAAQNNLGVMYKKGEGLSEPDPVQALKWFRAAARQKDPAGIHNLAGMYHMGEGGLEPDTEKAARLNLEAAEMGWADAQYNLGVSYARGIGFERDRREAVRWLRKAAMQDHPEAQNSLGVAYSDGKGVERDDEEAVKWFRAAAVQGARVAIRPPSSIWAVSTCSARSLSRTPARPRSG